VPAAALAAEPAPFAARLLPRANLLLYADIAMSLGYFSFSLPMSVYMAFVLKAGFPYGSPLMVCHHVMVLVAEVTFLLTGYPAFYMAASGWLFELTNVFFIPHVLMQQLRMSGTLATVNGVGLILIYTACRSLACTALVFLSLADLAAFDPPAGAYSWLSALVGLCCFYGLTIISWYWYVTSVVPALHGGLQRALGDTYYMPCVQLVPARLRQLLWSKCTPTGRAREREAQRKFRALRELRNEIAADAAEEQPRACVT